MKPVPQVWLGLYSIARMDVHKSVDYVVRPVGSPKRHQEDKRVSSQEKREQDDPC